VKTRTDDYFALDKEYGKTIELLHSYNEYLKLASKDSYGWVDNGLRVCSKVIGKPKDYKERGLALENELGRILKENVRYPKYYRLECPFGKYQRADALVCLGNEILVRIEAKYVGEKNTSSTWKYKNFLEWSTKYREKPQFFYPYTILYVNHEFYKLLNKEDFRLCYRNKLAIATFITLPRILEKIEKICQRK